MWKDLNMSQRAEVIQMAVKNGMRDLNQIRSFYDDSVNKFAMGGPEETIVTPSDNTRVNYSPSVYVGDSQELQDALNRRIATEGKAAYATARFLPFIKYGTDVVDWTSGDPTDAMQMAGNAVQIAGKGVARSYNGKNIGDKVMVGHRNHLRATSLTQEMIDGTKAFGNVVNKAGKVVALPGLIGDIVQSYNDYKNWIEAEQNFNNVSNRVYNERVKTHPALRVKALGGPLSNDVFAYGGPMGVYYDGWGDIGNWLKRKAKAGKKYLEEETEKISDLGGAAIEAVKSTVDDLIAQNLLEDKRRKKAYSQAKISAALRLDEAIKRFNGEPTKRSQAAALQVDASERGVKPNAYNQFNLQAPKKTREDYIADLKALSEEELKGVQKELADAGMYDHKLSGSRNYIKKVQQNLIKSGYLPEGEDDGIVGPKTQKAYNLYTRDMNVDGILGDRTINAYLGRNMNNDVSTKGIDGCAQWTTLKYESMADGKSLQNGVIGNAWQMLKNIESKGGSILYNIYDDDAFKNIRNVQDLKNKTVKALKEHSLDYSQLQIGDVVGIYMPSSDMHEVALKDGTTKNTHVGIVTGFNKDGVPIIEHNIHQSHRSDLITNLSGSRTGKAQVTTVARPAYVNVKTDVKEAQWQEKESKFQVDKKFQNKSITHFADSMAGIAPQIQKLYPDVDVDAIQEIALAVQKRETNFMTNNTSKQGLVSKAMEEVGNLYRTFKGQTDFTKSSDLAKMKMAALTENERKFLGITSKADMEDPKKAGAAAALYLARNMNYLQNVRKMNPALGLTDEDVYNLTILSYNQNITDLGFDKGKLSQKEIKDIRKLYSPEAKVKDVNSSKYKHFGILGDLIYEKFEDGFTPYIGAAKDAAAKYITRK